MHRPIITISSAAMILFLGGWWSGESHDISATGGEPGFPKQERGRIVAHDASQEGQPRAASDTPNTPKGKDPASPRNGIKFPYKIPGSEIVIGKELVDETNALPTKEEQIQFLISILPPPDQKEKRLTDRQLSAIQLLSLADSDAAVDPLMARLDFAHVAHGSPCVHALARLGERSVEPVEKALQALSDAKEVTDIPQKVNALASVLSLIKKEKFPMYIDELTQRDDLKLSEEVRMWLHFNVDIFNMIVK